MYLLSSGFFAYIYTHIPMKCNYANFGDTFQRAFAHIIYMQFYILHICIIMLSSTYKYTYINQKALSRIKGFKYDVVGLKCM